MAVGVPYVFTNEAMTDCQLTGISLKFPPRKFQRSGEAREPDDRFGVLAYEGVGLSRRATHAVLACDVSAFALALATTLQRS